MASELTVQSALNELEKARSFLYQKRQLLQRSQLSLADIDKIKYCCVWISKAKVGLRNHHIAVEDKEIDELVQLIKEVVQAQSDKNVLASASPPPQPHIVLKHGLERLFNDDELQNIAYELQIDTDNLRRGTKPIFVISLIQCCAQRNQLRGLLDTARAKRPQYSWPDTITEQDVLPQAEAFDASTPPFNRIPDFIDTNFGFGLRALPGILAHDNVMVQQKNQLMDVFRVTRTQIGKLDTFKEIHDRLHVIQFSCYEPMRKNTLPFIDNEKLFDEITCYLDLVESIIEDLEAIGKNASYAQGMLSFLDDLHFAHQELIELLQSKSIDGLKRALFHLRTVLKVHPTRANTKLIDAAQDLPLTPMLALLQSISSATASLPETLETKRLNEDIDRLHLFNEQLQNLLKEHNLWQAITDRLQPVVDDAPCGDVEIQIIWPIVLKHAPTLYQSIGGSWAKTMRLLQQEISLAIDLRNMDQVRISLSRYHNCAASRFYRVDEKLRQHCRQLERLDLALSPLLGMR